MNWLTGWIQGMDTATVTRLYKACELYVADTLGIDPNSSEFTEAVVDTWQEVLETTQPEYNPLQRPDILRSPDTLVKSLTMFMTQRIQNYNTMFNASANLEQANYDMREAKKSGNADQIESAKTALKTRQSEFARSMGSVMASNAVYVAIRALSDGLMHRWDKFRDKETGEVTAKKIAERLAWMFGETMAGCIPLGNEAFTLLESSITGEKYYGLSVSGIGNINTALEDIVSLGQAVLGGKDEEKQKQKAYKAAKSLANMLGFPATNSEKLVKTVEDWYGEIKNMVENDAELGEYYDFSAEQNKNILFDALFSGDSEKADRAMARMGDNAEKNAKDVVRQHFDDGDIDEITARQMLIDTGLTEEDAAEAVDGWVNDAEYAEYMEKNPNSPLNQTAYNRYENSERIPTIKNYEKAVGDIQEQTGKSFGEINQDDVFAYLRNADFSEDQKTRIWNTMLGDPQTSYQDKLDKAQEKEAQEKEITDAGFDSVEEYNELTEKIAEAKSGAINEYDSAGDVNVLNYILDFKGTDEQQDLAMSKANAKIRSDYEAVRAGTSMSSDEVISLLLAIDENNEGSNKDHKKNGSITQAELQTYYEDHPEQADVIGLIWDSKGYTNNKKEFTWADYLASLAK